LTGRRIYEESAFWDNAVHVRRDRIFDFSLYLAANPCVYNGIGGLRGALLGSGLSVPHILFCVLGITGLFICVAETFFRKK